MAHWRLTCTPSTWYSHAGTPSQTKADRFFHPSSGDAPPAKVCVERKVRFSPTVSSSDRRWTRLTRTVGADIAAVSRPWSHRVTEKAEDVDI